MRQAEKILEKLYADYHEKVVRYIRGKVGNPHDAEDLTSSVFAKVCRKIAAFDETQSSASTWIYTITRNTVIDYYRTRKIAAEIPETLEASGSVDERLLNEEQLKELYLALMELDERSRDIIILHYYSGLALKEISGRIGMSYANLKLVHKKALYFLKKRLGED